MNLTASRLCSRRAKFAWCAICCGLLTACSKPEGIHQVTVEKSVQSERIDLPEGEQAVWFFKFSAPTDKVSDTVLQGFGQLLSTISLRNGKPPSYDLPEGWTEETGPAPRFRTIKIPGTNPPLEVTVNYLPANNPNSNEYLQENFNRWRGQLGLPPTSGESWYEDAEQASELVQVTNGRQTFTLTSLVGKTEEFGDTLMRAVMVTSGASPELIARQRAEMGSSDAETTGSSSAPFTSEKPAGWEQAAGNQFAVAAFTAKNDAGSVDVTVSPVGGEMLQNINRWCGQVGLPAMSPPEFAKSSSTIEIGGSPGTFVHLVGLDNAIVGAVVVHAGQQWFFKGRGPREAVAKEVDPFKNWLGTVKFQ